MGSIRVWKTAGNLGHDLGELLGSCDSTFLSGFQLVLKHCADLFPVQRGMRVRKLVWLHNFSTTLCQVNHEHGNGTSIPDNLRHFPIDGLG